jgi:hypothetical protein
MLGSHCSSSLLRTLAGENQLSPSLCVLAFSILSFSSSLLRTTQALGFSPTHHPILYIKYRTGGTEECCLRPLVCPFDQYQNRSHNLTRASNLNYQQLECHVRKLFSYIYISLQLCKMTDARASHINAKQGNIRAQNT